MLNKDRIPFEHHQPTSYPKSSFCHQSPKLPLKRLHISNIYLTYIVHHVPTLGTNGVSETDEFSENYQGRGGIIFNPKNMLLILDLAF